MLNKKAGSKQKPNPPIAKKNLTEQEIPPGCPVPSVTIEDDRTGTSIDTLKRAFADHYFISKANMNPSPPTMIYTVL
ncbi:MAG: hypothetical protein HC796_04255 [Synechococcaceae cyanobacterium RL_1_2]|nr:hypothetical protein [Synechococcaceae cyanobacterium RL_1_2]